MILVSKFLLQLRLQFLALSLRMFSNEDVTIGSWMLAMNVHHEDNRAICDPRCTPTSIAVWDIPKCSGKGVAILMLVIASLLPRKIMTRVAKSPGLCRPATKMRDLHKIDMCSKSPTLPPEDD